MLHTGGEHSLRRTRRALFAGRRIRMRPKRILLIPLAAENDIWHDLNIPCPMKTSSPSCAR